MNEEIENLLKNGQEKEIINLINNGELDVNEVIDYSPLIFCSIAYRMNNLFSVLLNNEKTNLSVTDGFDDPILLTLVFLYQSDEVKKTKKYEESLKKNIIKVLACPCYDFNLKNKSDNTTALLTACKSKKTAWVVKALLEKENIEVNTISDFNNTPIQACLKNNNYEALGYLLQREDLIIRDEDKKLAEPIFNILSKIVQE